MKQRKTVPRNPEKFEYAYLLFMQGVAQQDICTRVGIAAPTLKNWKETGGWEEKRAARTISIDDLMQKTLRKISQMLDDNDNFSADAFAKAVNQLKTLKTGNTIDDEINCFMAFQDYLIKHRPLNKTITDDLIKTIIRLQDDYVQTRLGHAGK
jgi:hypothetical protein